MNAPDLTAPPVTTADVVGTVAVADARLVEVGVTVPELPSPTSCVLWELALESQRAVEPRIEVEAGGTYTINGMNHTILDDRIPRQDLRTPDKKVGPPYRHRHRRPRQRGVPRAIDQDGCVRGESDNGLAAQRLGELVDGEVGEDGVVGDEEGEAGVAVEFGEETGLLEGGEGLVGAEEGEGFGEGAGEGEDACHLLLA